MTSFLERLDQVRLSREPRCRKVVLMSGFLDNLLLMRTLSATRTEETVLINDAIT